LFFISDYLPSIKVAISLYASINSAPSYYEGGKWYSYMASLSVFDGSL